MTEEKAGENTATAQAFSCRACGGPLEYAPGTTAMRCRQCAASIPIPDAGVTIETIAFGRGEGQDTPAPAQESQAVRCPGCGAEVVLPTHIKAQACAFCATPLVIDTVHGARAMRMQALLPFQVDRSAALGAFRSWLDGLWFAPGALKKAARQEGSLQGIYIPFRAFDSQTRTDYRGERGDDRLETYTDSGGRRQTRTVTDWSPAGGRVAIDFRNVLADGSRSLPGAEAAALEPWNLNALQPFQSEYLGGFAAEICQTDLEESFLQARRKMETAIETAVRRAIGGDRQRIDSLQTQHSGTAYKHVLLPVWISAYRFDGRIFRFVVNGQSGRVVGERPWSVWKIVALVLFVLLLLGWFFIQG